MHIWLYNSSGADHNQKHIVCVANANISCLSGDKKLTGWCCLVVAYVLKRSGMLLHSSCTAVIGHFQFAGLTEYELCL